MTSDIHRDVTSNAAAGEKPQSPDIIADIASSFTYASNLNAIPVLRSVGIENNSERVVRSLRLEIFSTPAFLRPKIWMIDRVIDLPPRDDPLSILVHVRPDR